MENLPVSKTISTTPHKYQELKKRKTTYKITSVYLGEINMKDALERLVVNKVVSEINSGIKVKIQT